MALVAPALTLRLAVADRRTTALHRRSSVNLMENHWTSWQRCRPAARLPRIAAVRIADDRGGLIRAPELLFRASELGLESFGANIANPALLAALRMAAERAARLDPGGDRRRRDGSLQAPARVRLELAEGGSVEAALAVAADGRNSMARAGRRHRASAPGPIRRRRRRPSFGHSRPHGDTVNELHRARRPADHRAAAGATLGPGLGGGAGEAQRLAGLADAAFAAALEERLQGVLGAIGDVGAAGRASRSAGQSAERMAAPASPWWARPPTSSRRSARRASTWGCAMLRAGRLRGRGPGAQGGTSAGRTCLPPTSGRARADVLAAPSSIDLLNRSLLADLLPVEMLRGLAAHLARRLCPAAPPSMQEGMGLAGPLPQPDAVDECDCSA